MAIGDATVAYMGAMCTDIVWREPGETIHFQVEEKPDGDLAISTAAALGSSRGSPAAVLAPQAVREMHGQRANSGMDRFTSTDCRRFHQQDSGGPEPRAPGPRVDGREGGSLPSEMVRSNVSVRRLVDERALALLSKLRQLDGWPRLRRSFEAAVRDAPGVDALLPRWVVGARASL
jgi:hypothetical protein